jgi:ceramide glucosyltransferase
MSPLAPLAAFLAVGWLCLAGQVLAVLRFARRPMPPTAQEQPAVTVLKPLHGAEPELFENLRSFVEQDYRAVQLVLGVGDPHDGALAAAHDLVRHYPERAIALVIERRSLGSNGKIANLENMLPAAEGDILVLADSDMRVGRGWLPAVTVPLRDPKVGVVTCLYKGVSTGGLWSELGAQQINFAFLPNALLAELLGIGGGCFGATIALGRATLGRIGGFAPFRDELADDHRIGEAVRRLGLAVVLSPYLVETRVCEPSLGALWRHELRWARTVRALAPAGFAASAAAHPLAIASIVAVLGGFGLTASLLLGITCLVRFASAAAVARLVGLPTRKLWMLPLRDALSFAVFVASWFGRRVVWRDQRLAVAPSGRMTVVDGEKLR